MSSSPGRPKTDPAYRLASKFWFHHVSHKLNKKAKALELHFMGLDDQTEGVDVSRPKLWEKYQSGRACPKIKGTRSKPSIVERVEQEVPFSSRVFTHSLWRLLSNEPLDMDDLREIYLSLHSDIRKLLVIQTFRKPDFFWRTPATVIDLKKLIIQGGILEEDAELWLKLDAAAALLAMVREAEIRQDMRQHIDALNAWDVLAHILLRTAPFIRVYHELQSLIVQRFLSVRYFHGGEHHKWTIQPARKWEVKFSIDI